jgi:hypothetical protein
MQDGVRYYLGGKALANQLQQSVLLIQLLNESSLELCQQHN